MDEQEYRAKQIEWDKASLDNRVKRWKQIMPANYSVPLPDPASCYLNEVDEMFIGGHFIGVILVCAGIIELVLAAQLKSRTQMTQDEVERLRLKQMVTLSHRLGILDDKEAQWIHKLRKLRNTLIHANTDRLNQIARKQYKECGLNTYDLDALTYLQLTRDLTVRFYGTKEPPHQ